MGDWIEENAERASHLLLFSIVYSEDFMTQFMDEMLVALYKVVLNTTNKVIMKRVSLSFRMLGRYCPPAAYEDLLTSAIKNELASYFPFTQAGSLKAFGYLFSGAIELIPDSQNLVKVNPLLCKFIKTVKENILDALDIELSQILVLSVNEMLDALIIKKEE